MGKKDPRIDAYIAKAAPFAKPILTHIRKLVHRADPDVEETLKWGMPSFLHDGILCGMAGFKAHCTFGFWKGKLILAKDGKTRADEAMGQFGRLASLADLPPDKVMLSYIKEAVRLNVEKVQVPSRARPKAKQELVVPDYFKAALRNNKKAIAAFEAFSYSHRKEYVEWVTEAKQEETRQRRLATTVEWLAEGKSRNWKYERC